MLSRTRALIHTIADHKFIFAAFFLFVFVMSFILLYFLNLVPDQLYVTDLSPVAAISNGTTSTSTLPIRITIEKVGVDALISDPSTTNNDTLNTLLTKGAVRYPGSGLPGQGNLFLFGHSTSIKIVNNQAYKTFNGLKNLSKGDLIAVYTGNKKYIYSVSQVLLVNSQDVQINIKTKKAMLTLSTCNTLGAKEERYVVEASYVGVEAVTTNT